ncbi:MAG: 2,3-bisphosphoglycerate-dependent phosphoglycerate mutase [SAR86 cluster bacterium]|nr:2,3-bisphosphoglycerate-dependent phosphoglycerate mutase [SAR86 cluster bacterium]
MNNKGLLVLVRHGQSAWNEKNLFTGWKDPDLTLKGIKEAKETGVLLKRKKLLFDVMFTSALKRAQKTGQIILEQLNQDNLETIKDKALNERNYGDLAGLNKDEARKRWGNEQVHIWRRSFDVPPPGGESLLNTSERVIPYFEEKILPLIVEEKNVLVTAHGNSLRALIMKLKSLTPDEVVKLEIATGQPIAFSMKSFGEIEETTLKN